MAEEEDDWGDSSETSSQTSFTPYKPEDDQKLHFLAMCFLGSVAILGLMSVAVLQFCAKEIPDVLSVVIGSSVTAIAALFKVR